MDLSTASVFIDFDGTISTVDIGDALMERFGAGDWKRLDDLYEGGVIGSRECMSRQFAMLRAIPAELLAHARSIPLDPGFGPLRAYLRRRGSSVTVLSDGFGFYVEELCRPFEVEVTTNEAGDGGMRFPNADPACPCAACGTCKVTPIRRASADGRTTIFIGDGTSDRHAATTADVVFAKTGLARWCRDQDIPFTEYRTLADVLLHLQRAAGDIAAR